ncbi:hypothetical protein [Halomonas korlensis]|uniref:Uncharacterized protein n=1 Tax=Halomonas korlensis TaxID=463301 RepID=A0A1I7EWA3_9GAMM|nr:hypothetical protein [Halomonas korlensis]SFU28192.1 hypothetical protein SAMN04487955_10136 [Halomonas korlensis]
MLPPSEKHPIPATSNANPTCFAGAQHFGQFAYLISGTDKHQSLASVRHEHAIVTATALREHQDKTSERMVRRLAARTEAGHWFWEVLTELDRRLRQLLGELRSGDKYHDRAIYYHPDQETYEKLNREYRKNVRHYLA